MTILARLQIASPANQRSSPRRKLRLGSSIQASGEDVTIHDLSPTGILIETEAELAPFDGLEIELPEVGVTQAVIVWNGGHFYGCEFKERVSQAVVSAALLRSPPATPVELLPSPDLVESPKITAPSAQALETLELSDVPGEEKASLTIRLRVILGSSIVLWALTIWAAWSLIKLIR